MSVEIHDNNLNPNCNSSRVPTSSFVNIATLTQSKSKKPTSHSSKANEKSVNDANSPQDVPSKTTIITTHHEDFEIPKDENVSGMTLDKILGATFRQIDLSTIKDFSNELFPSKPTLSHRRSRTNPKKRDNEHGSPKTIAEEPKDSSNRNVREINTTTEFNVKESIVIESTKEHGPNMNKSLAGTIKAGRKDSQNSLMLDKRDSLVEEAIVKPIGALEKISQESLSRRFRVKGRAIENNSYSPTPIHTKNKFINAKRKVMPKTEEIPSISQVRSIDYTGERKKVKQLNDMIRKVDEGIKDLSFGIEGKSIDWSGKRLGHKNSIHLDVHNRSPDKRSSAFKAAAIEESFGRGNVKIIEMLKEGAQGYLDHRVGQSRGGKHNLENEQWDLFNKYGNKFGIKAQEYFGLNAPNRILESKTVVMRHSKVGKTPTPFLNKKSYGEIDLYRVKVQNKNIFKDGQVKGVL